MTQIQSSNAGCHLMSWLILNELREPPDDNEKLLSNSWGGVASV